MAKRRNLKKEKAERNRANARQFRKRTTGTFNNKRRGYQRNTQKSEDEEPME